MRTLYF
jgi:trafficking protein particle complex subunit 13